MTAGNLAGRRNSLINHGMRRIRPSLQAINRDQEQGAHLIGGERSFEQAGEEKVTATIGAQGAVDKILHSRPGRRVDTAKQPLGQTLPAKHGGIDTGGLQKGKSE